MMEQADLPLRRAPEVVVATPGRLLDALESNGLSLSRVSALLLDECMRADHAVRRSVIRRVVDDIAASTSTFARL